MNRRTLAATASAALAVLTGIAPMASAAESSVAAERFGGAASGRAVHVELGGQGFTLGGGMAGSDLDPVQDDLNVSATGIGSASEPGTIVGAGMGESREQCAVPSLEAAGLEVDAQLVCGRASVEGTADGFVAEGAGRLAGLSVSVGEILAGLFDDPQLAAVRDLAFGEIAPLVGTAETAVDETVDPELQHAADLLNGTLNGLVGDVAGTNLIPTLDASDTLAALRDRLAQADLVDVRLGEASGTVDTDAGSLVARAQDQGAEVALIPGFFADGTPLATITVTESIAEVTYRRTDASTEGGSKIAVVTVESALLPSPVTVEPGESVELFCGLVDTLCSEVSVASPSEETADGRLRVQSALVEIDLARGLELPALPALPAPPADPQAATGLVPATALEVLNGALREHPVLDEGIATPAADASGVTIVLGGATAEAGGTKVLSEVEDQTPFQGSLPRTGLESLAGPALAFLAAGGGLRTVLRRRSS